MGFPETSTKSPAPSGPRRTVEEYEAEIGRQVRALRIDSSLTQEDLARAADLSVSAVKGLESGKGSGLASLIKALRALGRADWLTELAPTEPAIVSPMQQLRDQRRAASRPRQRVRRPTGS